MKTCWSHDRRAIRFIPAPAHKQLLRTTREGALRVSVLGFILRDELVTLDKLHLVSFRLTIDKTGDQIFAVLKLLSFRFVFLEMIESVFCITTPEEVNRFTLALVCEGCPLSFVEKAFHDDASTCSFFFGCRHNEV